MPRTPASYSGLNFGLNVGASSAVSLTNITALQSLTALTIEGWTYLYGLPQSGHSIMVGPEVGNTGYYLRLNANGGLEVVVGNGSTNVIASTNSISLNAWHHLAGTWDGSNVRLFVDGTLVATTALSGGNTGNTGTAPVIGNMSGVAAWPGIISEVRISNIARYTAAFTPPIGPFTPDSNTIGLYHFNEGTGTVAHDSSSQGNNGTLSGSPLPTWSAGKWYLGANTRAGVSANPRSGVQNFNASLGFNGASSTVQLGTGGPYSGNITAGAWIKPGVMAANNVILSKRSAYSTAGDNWGLYISQLSGQIKLTTQANTTFFAAYAPLEQWSFVAWVHDTVNSLERIYINGVQAATASLQTLGTASNNVLAIGSSQTSPTQEWFFGSIANAFIYGSALNASQILGIYAQGNFPAGAYGIYPLTEGAGSTAYDSSGNGNNGTITSGTYTSDVPSKARRLVNRNLVYNGGFEFAPPSNVAQTSGGKWIDGTSGGSSSNNLFSWALYTHVNPNAIQFDNTNSHSGNYSLKVSTTSTGSQEVGANSPNAIQSIPVLPSTSYILTFWMKTTANSGAANTGAFMAWKEWLGNGSGGNTYSSTGVTTTTGWTQYMMVHTTGSTAAYLMLQPTVAGNDGTGTLIMDAWFDDIVLTPVATPVRAGVV